jgi:hypothetical protein
MTEISAKLIVHRDEAAVGARVPLKGNRIEWNGSNKSERERRNQVWHLFFLRLKLGADLVHNLHKR